MDFTASPIRGSLDRILCLPQPNFPPLAFSPCANIHVKESLVCPKPGTRACSSCRLVSYCSKECQKDHWNIHKRDCKNIMLTEAWKPIWTLERRSPRFITDDTIEQDFSAMQNDEFSGISLWGNTPAMDVINLKCNENESTMDFNLAFIASGDLRHVMKTINLLPSDYSGHLNILLNDHAPHVVSRNMLLLLVLSTIPDETLAADIALHFWYSLFMPSEYFLRISAVACQFLASVMDTGQCEKWKLGPLASMSCHDLHLLTPFFQHYIKSSDDFSRFQAEYDRMRQAPSRRDYQDRMYSQLRPSHRVAFQKYRRFGLILPFGAINAHFNAPNQSLFTFRGRWLQTDYADPLEGWDIDEVIRAGKSYGAQPEDIYGCLYFFLSQELRTLAKRLRQFRVNFIITTLDASSLAMELKENKFEPYALPASTLFDRIHVSNILDANYVGIDNVLKHWSPLLAHNRTAAIIGYFMNWFVLQGDGRVSGAKELVTKKVMKRMTDDGRATLPSPPGRIEQITSPLEIQKMLDEFQTALYFTMSSLDFYYDNYRPFVTFLEKQGLPQILLRDNLRLRDSHTIIPHRIQTSLDAKPNSVPRFSDDSWYHTTSMLSHTGAERFVEFSRC